MAPKTDVAVGPVSFETSPDRYRHLRVEVDGPIARILLDVQEDQGLRPGYALKLNSYDLGVDIELADAVQRLRFEHPEVGAVIVTSAKEGIFSSGANIFMLGTSSHAFKVNFCKYTNETRLSIEDATEQSGQVYIAALNGIASGGGYELPLACQEIYLVDDRRSAVALPEIPYLGVLPGTGGLTRVVDKRKVRRDLADVFVTLAEGVKGKRAVEWGLVDGVFPPSRFNAAVEERARALAARGPADRASRRGVVLEPLQPEVGPEGIRYRHLDLTFGPQPRTARLSIRTPDVVADMPARAIDVAQSLVPLRLFRELDDALLRLRFNHPEVGVVLVDSRGKDSDALVRIGAELAARAADDWFCAEVLNTMRRALKRMDMTAKSFFALVDEGSCFAGSLFEITLACDRTYALDTPSTRVHLSPLNAGPLKMGNGLTRLQARFLGDPAKAARLQESLGSFTAAEAAAEGLITAAVDPVDWDDEIRLAVEERASLSPDSLTGMEASLRFAGPETMETKIFGRLSAWQNWIFQRPNAVGDRGALTLYGRPESPEFDWKRT